MKIKMMARTFLLATAAVLLFSSCGTLFTKGGGDYREGERAYKNGNYALAVEKALAAVAVNSEFPEAEDLLNRAATNGPKLYLSRIEELKSSGNPLAWGDVAALYEELNKIYDYLNGAGKAEAFGARRFNDELEEAKQTAAENYYIAGVEELNKGDFRSARTAVGHFRAVSRFAADYKDSAELLKKATEAATAVIAIHQNGASDTLLEGIKKELSARGVNAQFTRYLFNSNLGTGEGASYSEVLGAAKAQGADYVIYLNTSFSGEVTPAIHEKGISLDSGNFTGNKSTYGYTQEMAVDLQVMDLVEGQRLLEEMVRVENGDSFSIYSIHPTEKRDLNLTTLGKGTFDLVSVASYSAINPGMQDSFYNQIRSFVTNADLDEIREMDRWYQLKDYFEGKTVFVNVEILHDQETDMYSAIYSNDPQENQEYSAKSMSLAMLASSKPGPLAQEAAGNETRLMQKGAPEIAGRIADMIK